MAAVNFGAAHATAAAAGAAHAAAAAGAAQATAAATGATAATVRLATGPPGGRRRFAGPVNAKAEKSIRGDRTSSVVSRGSSQSGARIGYRPKVALCELVRIVQREDDAAAFLIHKGRSRGRWGAWPARIVFQEGALTVAHLDFYSHPATRPTALLPSHPCPPLALHSLGAKDSVPLSSSSSSSSLSRHGSGAPLRGAPRKGVGPRWRLCVRKKDGSMPTFASAIVCT